MPQNYPNKYWHLLIIFGYLLCCARCHSKKWPTSGEFGSLAVLATEKKKNAFVVRCTFLSAFSWTAGGSHVSGLMLLDWTWEFYFNFFFGFLFLPRGAIVCSNIYNNVKTHFWLFCFVSSWILVAMFCFNFNFCWCVFNFHNLIIVSMLAIVSVW